MDRRLARIVFVKRGRMNGSSRFSGLFARVSIAEQVCSAGRAGRTERLLLEPERPDLDDGGEVTVRLVLRDGHDPRGPPAAVNPDHSGGRPPVHPAG
jgi:hypothetical protein